MRPILQTEATECGLACIAMISNHYGHRCTLNELRQHINVSMEGSTLLDLMHIAARLDLTTRPLRIELNQLSALQTPCILHWNLNHFVVLARHNATTCWIFDPAFGERKMKFADMSPHFTGVALELHPAPNFKKKQANKQFGLRDLITKITGLKRSLAMLAVLTFLLQGLSLLSPFFVQIVVDNVLPSMDGSLLWMLGAGFALVIFFEAAASALRGLLLLNLGASLSIQMGARLFQHLIRLPLVYFEKRHIGDVLSKFGSLRQVKELLTTGIIEVLIDGIMAIVVLLAMLTYNRGLALVVLATATVYVLFRILLYGRFRSLSERQILAQSKEQSHFIESVRAIQTIKTFGAEVKRESAWQNLYVAATNQDMKLGHFNIGYQATNRLLFGLENIIVIYFAAHQIIAGVISTGMLFAFVAYKGMFVDRVTRLIEKWIQFRMLGLHFDRLADIAETPREVLYADTDSNMPVAGAIEVRALNFAYSDSAPPVIKDLSFSIDAGESVAIVGPSGSGKSTLMKLMLGLMQPTTGEILLDGRPIAYTGLAKYREQVAAVLQDDQLLSGSIQDNITFFDAPIDMGRVIECAQRAAIHADISKMPMGYLSLVGDMGSALSGGQKQRILLARALYRRPKILFLDEATSHLDIETEANVSRSVGALSLTRIIIAHRPETISSADRVIELSAGTWQRNKTS